VAVLEYDPQFAVLEVGPVVFDDVLVVAQLEDLDFLLDGGQLGVGGRRQDLYGVEVARALVECLRDAAVRALPKVVQQLELHVRVGRLRIR
jgi:hypothetical protein